LFKFHQVNKFGSNHFFFFLPFFFFVTIFSGQLMSFLTDTFFGIYFFFYKYFQSCKYLSECILTCKWSIRQCVNKYLV